MCGLFGWYKLAGDLTPTQIQAARRARDTMLRRGPDAAGEWISASVFMGHRRLSIIDLSEHANQPFADSTGRYRLCFNGEIYNYLEIRTELEALGVSFTTSSDTEVMVEAFAHWGEDALTRFDGMFAGALHDCQTGRHLVFRDPLGQKPLYWADDGQGGLVYASDLAALTALEGMSWTLDRAAFRTYLSFGYFPWDQTPLGQVRKLLPGCKLVQLGGRRSIERWWDSVPGRHVLDLEYPEAVDEVERLFDRSCAMSLRSDVPFGVLLSGGIDSTLVLSSCHKSAPDIRSFSVQMGEADFDETDKARQAVAHCGSRNHQSFLLDRDGIVSALGDFLSWVEEPHADPGFVNAFFVARACRPEVTVALAGDGADELFCGYAPFKGLGAERLGALMPAPVAAIARQATSLLHAGDGYLGLAFKARSFLQGFPAPARLRVAWWLSTLPPEDLARLAPTIGFFARDGRAGSMLHFLDQVMATADSDSAERLAYFYQKIFLPEFVCHHTDRAAMQVSLEVRSPFLSVPLVELANRLPRRFKMKDGEQKRPLKEILRRRNYPTAIVDQRKQGFTFPLARWLKGPLRSLIDEMMVDPASWSGGEIDAKVLAELAADHFSGRHDNGRILYALVVFRAWRRRYPGLEFA